MYEEVMKRVANSVIAAAEPKIKATKSVKLEATGKDETSAGASAASRVKSEMTKSIKNSLSKNMAGWIPTVETSVGKVKRLGDGNKYDVTVKAAVTITFSHPQRINDAIERAVKNIK